MALLLAVIPVALVLGHRGGALRELSLTESYVSEYLSTAPHWPWIVVAVLSFGVLLLALAFGLLQRAPKVLPVTLGCLLLAAGSVPVFFVAYAPMRRVQQPPPEHLAWWSPGRWFVSSTAQTPYQQGLADAYSDLHYHAIKLVLISGLAGLLLLGAGCIRHEEWRGFGRWTLIGAVIMGVLFVAGDQLPHQHGLWQRLGFGLMYAWLCTATRRVACG